MTEPSLQWRRVVSQPFDENTYIAFLTGKSAAVIVDPGFEPDKILAVLEDESLVPCAILNTHGHSDHIAGNAALKEAWPDAPLIVGQGDAPKLTDPALNLSAMFGLGLTSPPADQTVTQNDTLELAGLRLTVREAPGHSSGHVLFLCQQHEPWVVFGGDLLFRGSIGRSDFPDGSHETLLHSIRRQLLTLPDETIVLPGHGPATTIGEEREFNPFL